MLERLSRAPADQDLREYRDKNPLKFWSVFPNTSDVAAYFALTQHIELYQIDAAMVQRAHAGESTEKLCVFPTLWHELRHWLDHVATLWGQKNMVVAFNAMHARLAEVETELWRIVEYRKATRRDRFQSYFTTVNDRMPPTHGHRRWVSQLSCGLGFDADGKLNERRPIVFTRFSWEDGRLACRVPFSVASLLESNATHYENAIEYALISLLPNGVRQVELSERGRRDLAHFYDPDLAVYSVAAHFVANRFGMTDVPRTLEVASCLATLSLNLPDSWFSKMKISDRFSHWGTRTHDLMVSRDRGFAFMNLADNAPPPTEGQSLEDWADVLLVASNLPPLAQLRMDALAEMEHISITALDGTRGEILKSLLNTGRDLLTRVGPTLPFEPVLTEFPRVGQPAIVLSDLSVMFPSGEASSGSAQAIENWIFTTQRLHKRFEEFAEACGL